jgi:hypothetical protein
MLIIAGFAGNGDHFTSTNSNGFALSYAGKEYALFHFALLASHSSSRYQLFFKSDESGTFSTIFYRLDPCPR